MSRKKVNAIHAEIEVVRRQREPEQSKDECIALFVHFYNSVVNILEGATKGYIERKCPRCKSIMFPNTILKLLEVDYVCTNCDRGWKLVNRKWYSRFTRSQEIYDEEGNQLQ